MGVRFRKSVKLGKGVSLNLNKKSVGVTVGGKGAKYTVNSSGKRTASVGIPGSGLSYSQSSGGGKKATSNHSKIPMKTGVVPLVLTILFGWMGLHWFISGRIGMGLLYFFTGGLFGVGWIVDIIRQIVALAN